MTATSENALQLLDEAASDPRLSEAAVENIRKWLTEPRYRDYVAPIQQHLQDGLLQELDDAFWTVIPFGTGGRRGRMYPIGCNAINDRTIGESAQGLADYVRDHGDTDELSCAIAYDTRHKSRHFAELCASVMVANGFKVYFLDDYRSTPELSFLVRERSCSCGIMVTASHNPPSDNAVKVYWSSGGQVLPPHDAGIIARVMEVDEIQQADFEHARDEGQVVICTEETDEPYHAAVIAEQLGGPRDLKIIYSPLHGVGEKSVTACLAGDGFTSVEVYPPHQQQSGDFPNVPGHVSNPENPQVFAEIIEYAKQRGAELILATDPDCDRMGCAAPLTLDASGPWATFNGNQLGALLCDYILDRRQAAGQLSGDDFIVTTLVTTMMLKRIAEHYGARALTDQLVGFKWICGRADQEGIDHFVFGAEESHGYLVGKYARDKDGAVACMLMCELAAQAKADGLSLHDKLAALQWQHGCHAERLLNLFMEGSEGMAKMTQLMSRLRNAPPESLGGIKIARVRDYEAQTVRDLSGGESRPLEGPLGNLIILDLEAEGNYIAVRPSGTEPKVKFYLFSYVPAEQIASLEATAEELQQRLSAFEADMRAYAAAQ